jgi:hypothetical protein
MTANTMLDNPAQIIKFLKGKMQNSPSLLDGYSSPRLFHYTAIVEFASSEVKHNCYIYYLYKVKQPTDLGEFVLNCLHTSFI